MKKARAAVCVVLSLVLILSFSLVSVAKGGETADVVISTDKSSYESGDNAVVTVSVATNYNCIAMRWFVLYSKSVFEVDASNGNFGVTEGFDSVGGSTVFNLTGNVSYPQGYSSDEYGIVLIQWVGGGENLAVFNHPQLLDCFKFFLKVREDAPENAVGEIFIPDNSSYYNVALDDANDASTYYKANGLVCTFEGANVAVKGSVEPQLLPVDGTDTVIDDTRKIVYGFTNGINGADDILNYVCAVGDGTTIEIDETEQGCGTGTVIRLVQNGVTVDSYTVIYLGDATGDAVVDESDIVLIDLYNAMMYMPDETEPVFAGMDSTLDGVVDEADFVLVDLSVAYMGEIDQVNGGIIFY